MINCILIVKTLSEGRGVTNPAEMFMYLAFTIHATVSDYHFLCTSTFLDNLKLFINSFSQLVESLILCDVTDKISRINYAPPPYCMPE